MAEPTLERIDTWNAKSNRYMIAANEVLGYTILGEPGSGGGAGGADRRRANRSAMPIEELGALLLKDGQPSISGSTQHVTQRLVPAAGAGCARRWRRSC